MVEEMLQHIFKKDKRESRLIKNRNCFNWAWSRSQIAANKKLDSVALAWIDVAARLTYGFHPGFYNHPQVEQLLLAIGARHIGGPIVDEIQNRTVGKRHWLHVLTTALPVGGHTKLVETWIQNARSNSEDLHSILLLDQDNQPCPEWLTQAAECGGGQCLTLPRSMDPTDRALALRELASKWADVVVLHTHPNDPIATVAFANGGGPPVVLLNHADHVFWLGTAIADLVADIRLVGQELSQKRRGVRQSILLPIPLHPPRDSPDREACRERLGIPKDRVMLLSVGASYKYKPFGDLNFSLAMLNIAERNPSAIIIIIGPSPDEPEWQRVIKQSKESIIVLGVIPNIKSYYLAADIYLEGFPLGSITASLDAALIGTPVVRAPMLVASILGIDQYPGMSSTARTMIEYYTEVDRLIRDQPFRLAAAENQQASVMNLHSGKNWQIHLNHLIDQIPQSHEPATINNNLDVQPEDWIWAELQASQVQKAGGMWRACCTALRLNGPRIGKLEILSGLLRCPAWREFAPNIENFKEFAKFIIFMLAPLKLYSHIVFNFRKNLRS